MDQAPAAEQTGRRDALVLLTVFDLMSAAICGVMWLFGAASFGSSPTGGSIGAHVVINVIFALAWASLGAPLLAWSLLPSQPKTAVTIAAIPPAILMFLFVGAPVIGNIVMLATHLHL